MQRRSHSVGGGNELPKGLAHPRAACSTQCTIAEISFYRKQVDHDRLFSRAAALLTVEQWDDMYGLPKASHGALHGSLASMLIDGHAVYRQRYLREWELRRIGLSMP